MAKVYGAVTIDSARCKGCNLCVVACPCKVLALQPKSGTRPRLSLCIRRQSRSLHRMRRLRHRMSRCML